MARVKLVPQKAGINQNSGSNQKVLRSASVSLTLIFRCLPTFDCAMLLLLPWLLGHLVGLTSHGQINLLAHMWRDVSVAIKVFTLFRPGGDSSSHSAKMTLTSATRRKQKRAKSGRRTKIFGGSVCRRWTTKETNWSRIGREWAEDLFFCLAKRAS